MLEEHQRAAGDISSSRSASQQMPPQQQQRRSKSEESLLDRADVHYLAGGGSCCSSSACSRRNSPLSHSSSAHQHLGQQRGSATPPVVVGRSSFLRDRSFVKEDSPTSLSNKSRIPVPVSNNRDGVDKGASGLGLDHHRYTGSNHDSVAASSGRAEYHPSSYAVSAGRYEPVHTSTARYTSPYISPYTPPSSSHHISSYTPMMQDRPDHSSSGSSAYTSTAYRPTSAKEYNTRYNYYSSVPDPEVPLSSYLSGSGGSAGGSTSPRWRRRSYDHDSDFVRYQRRSRPLSDYPTTSAAMASSAGPSASAAALTRSRSRSRVSEYDAYRGGGDGGSYLVGTYTSRPGAGYLYGHSYYHDSSEDSGRLASTVRHPRPPDYPPLSAEVSGRTRRYQPEK
jgi:hypothetical protein